MPNHQKAAKARGHKAERNFVKEFKSLGYPEAMTTREGSRFLDGSGIDLMNIGLWLPQVKAEIRRPNYISLIKRIEESNVSGIPLVIHQDVEKRKSRFYFKDAYVILKWEDFKNLIS